MPSHVLLSLFPVREVGAIPLAAERIATGLWAVAAGLLVLLLMWAIVPA